ncbi:MAG: ribosomal protein [Francisellaceae bacterium]|nr:ribosomal protein [Francisellaceae bacterium]
MPRRRVAAKRPIQADPVYGSQVVAKFINQIMVDGEKSIAQEIVYGALKQVENRSNRDPLSLFEKALEHIRPMVEVKSRRVGGATYQVPIEIPMSRAMALAMRWLADFSRKRGEKNMMLKLAGEILDASDEEGGARGKGGAVKKREDTHRMAEANKAFSHYRW